MFENCKVKGEYCNKFWLGLDGLCDCLVEYPNQKCKEAIKIKTRRNKMTANQEPKAKEIQKPKPVEFIIPEAERNQIVNILSALQLPVSNSENVINVIKYLKALQQLQQKNTAVDPKDPKNTEPIKEVK